MLECCVTMDLHTYTYHNAYSFRSSYFELSLSLFNLPLSPWASGHSSTGRWRICRYSMNKETNSSECQQWWTGGLPADICEDCDIRGGLGTVLTVNLVLLTSNITVTILLYAVNAWAVGYMCWLGGKMDFRLYYVYCECVKTLGKLQSYNIQDVLQFESTALIKAMP